MSDTYTKLFSSITASTVWSEPPSTRLVWITMLAMADQHGRVWASVPGLARIANVTLDDTVRALETLSGPDQWSRTPDNEGRRIAAIDGGWQLLNHAKYRGIRSADERREYWRLWKADKRAAEKSNECPQVSTKSTGSTPPTPTPTPTPEKDQKQLAPQVAKEPRSRGTRLPTDWQPTPRDLAQAEQSRPDLNMREVVANFRDYWTAKAGKDATKLDWDATFRVWIRNQKPAATKPGSKVRSAYDALTQTIQEFKHGSGMVSGLDRARGAGLPALGFGGPAFDGDVSSADSDMD